jgi:hypothetical protein
VVAVPICVGWASVCVCVCLSVRVLPYVRVRVHGPQPTTDQPTDQPPDRNNKVWATPTLQDAPIVILGIGNGGSVASYLAANLSELSEVEPPPPPAASGVQGGPRVAAAAAAAAAAATAGLLSAELRHCLEGVLCVNPLVYVDKQVRQTFQRLLKMPSVASRQERVQHLCAVLFSQVGVLQMRLGEPRWFSVCSSACQFSLPVQRGHSA